jgi:hypothetical protein
MKDRELEHNQNVGTKNNQQAGTKHYQQEGNAEPGT